MTAEEPGGLTTKESRIKVALHSAREPPSINEEFPKGRTNVAARCASHTIDKTMTGGTVNKDKTIFMPPRGRTITITYIHCDTIKWTGAAIF
jgi:hypothetical protein